MHILKRLLYPNCEVTHSFFLPVGIDSTVRRTAISGTLFTLLLWGTIKTEENKDVWAVGMASHQINDTLTESCQQAVKAQFGRIVLDSLNSHSDDF